MSHYFHTPRHQTTRHLVRATVWDRDLELVSAPGVFSAHRLDPGTAVLLRETDPPHQATRLVDLGCGLGTLAIGLALHCPAARVDAVDVNDLALALTRENARRLGVGERVRTGRPEDFDRQETYDQLWSNPPIRIGKAALHRLLADWLPRLRPGGIAWLVVGKNLGADSLHRWLTDQGWPTRRHAAAKGFRVLRVRSASGGRGLPAVRDPEPE